MLFFDNLYSQSPLPPPHPPQNQRPLTIVSHADGAGAEIARYRGRGVAGVALRRYRSGDGVWQCPDHHPGVAGAVAAWHRAGVVHLFGQTDWPIDAAEIKKYFVADRAVQKISG